MGRSLAERLVSQEWVVLDGALATELERRGHDLDHPLWSARLLDEHPEEIVAVHRSYLEAGAEVITSAGYQASPMGFERAGFSPARAEELYRRSVRLALEARRAHEAEHGPERPPLVALSIGPFAALLADGSEYTGYGDAFDPGLVEAYHRPGLALAVDELGRCGEATGLVALETVPSVREAERLGRLLGEFPSLEAWLAFTCRDGAHTTEGQPIEEGAAALADVSGLAALGVNCTDPRHVPELLRRLARVTDLPLVAYPNSGETFDGSTKRWLGSAAPATPWLASGARLVGGCCRTGPADIAALAALRGRA